MKKNKINKIKMSGGIVGLIDKNKFKKIRYNIEYENNSGWNVVQIINDDTNNVLVLLLRLIILIVTFFSWTIADGYLIIYEREI